MAKPEMDLIQVAGRSVRQQVVDHVRNASRETGISFGYLMAKAARESNFDSNTKNALSSAAGLYQFTKGTWFEMIKQHGAKYGLGELSDQITRDARGEYSVPDPEARKEILGLRRDPKLSALMAGEYANGNRALIEKALGRPANATDLYLAHFLGPGGALKVLRAREENPEQPAAELLPEAAASNKSVFYQDGSTPRSVAGLYDRISRSIEPPARRYANLEKVAEPVATDAAPETAPEPPKPSQLAFAAPQPRPEPVEMPDYRPEFVTDEPENLLALVRAEGGTFISAPMPQPAQPLAQTVAVSYQTAALTVPDQMPLPEDSPVSAATISLPMPPRPTADGMRTYSPDPLGGEPKGLNKLLKTLFG